TQEKLAGGVDLNNYLNLLKATDKAFEKMMNFLREKGLADKTVVVILGDHGEAFGEHGTYIHAGGVYEENVHIPAIIVNSALFSGGRSDRIGGMSDFSPTVLD